MTGRHATTAPRRRRSGDGGERRREPVAERLLFWVVVADVGLLALAGGPPPGLVSTILFVVAAVAIVALLAFGEAGGERRASSAVRALLIAIVALPALQLVPLPPAWWHALPDGERRGAALALVGAGDAWQPLSIVPVDTASATLLAFCFAVLLAAMVALRERRFEQLLIALGVVALVNVGVGIMQAASGGSPRILANADHGDLLGFFANKNHAGVAIAASLALCAYLVEMFAATRARRRLWLGAATLLALVCAVPTNSRAGVLLTLAVALWIVLRFLATGKLWVRVAVAGGGAALLGLLSLSPVFDKVYSRFGGVTQDLRWRFIEQSRPLAHDHALLGAGGGSFSRLFIVNERLAWVKPTIVNETHNEYLQTLIEYGIPGVALLLSVIVVLGWLAWKGWRLTDPASTARRQLETGAVIVLLFLVHSTIDYPLRRPASWALFAAGCALVIRNAAPAGPRRQADGD